MKKTVFIAGMLLVLFSSTTFANTPPAADVIAKAWDYMRGKTSVSQVKMTVHRANWERVSVIKAWTRGRNDSIFQITAPKKDKGNGTLKIGRDMWTYNPKINRVIKIPPSMMSQSWMGSDFSNNDLSKADSLLNDYTHEIETTTQENGITIYTIKSLPKPDAPVVWGMQKLKIREDGIIIEQGFYDEDMAAVKIMTTSEIKKMGEKLFPARWVMRAMDADSKEDYTLLEYESLEFDIPLQDSGFTLNALKKPLR
ncbi:outer membrane lipoprotein-sorting protein [uncultured Desulfobacter sp.]|uniref:outer membrane lipoprotein-sorting protein n=1 Tax=uncultured Desulfobacter sp. TaxID=240139 RepID=UPI0029F45D02|nr:outer membrane lipoprotein-sorting protein [uncultured Desulfobacter sp.]